MGYSDADGPGRQCTQTRFVRNIYRDITRTENEMEKNPEHEMKSTISSSNLE